MRILIVSHPPLDERAGAAQVAMNLAASLRERGHDALAWSPAAHIEAPRWWRYWRQQGEAIERFVRSSGPFDVVDTPAISAARLKGLCRTLMVRSVQPELRYLATDVGSDLIRTASPRAALNALLSLSRAAAILAGWRAADHILCLGTLERVWMSRRFPLWRDKLGTYFNAPGEAERSELASIRQRRIRREMAAPARFLWIGRWSSHKGISRLTRWAHRSLRSRGAGSLTIAGCGEAGARAAAAALPNGVRIVPHFSRPELGCLLLEHDVGLFTSTVEGWGLSLAEMLESGMPVWATAAGAVPDLQPFFPNQLRRFPPDSKVTSPLDDPESSGYMEQVSWPAIAASYEEQLGRGERPT